MAEYHFSHKHYRLQALFAMVALIFLFALWTAIPNDGTAASDLNETALLQLKKGEVIVHVAQSEAQNKETVEAIILIDAPAAPVWRIMTDCEAAPSFVPGLTACRVLESGGDWEIIRHETEWIWFLPRISYVFRADYQHERRISFRRIRGGLREMKGSWRLESLNNGRQTVVRYRVYLDPGFYVPQWIVRQSLKRNLPAVLIALRTKVQNNHWRSK